MKNKRFYQDCLERELSQRIQKNSQFSLRSFAKHLQMDAGTLSKILNGKKIPTPKISEKMIERLELSPRDQKAFLHSMAKAYEEEGVQRKKPMVKDLLKAKMLKPQFVEDAITADTFKAISDWYHYAILQLTQVEGFQSDSRWISKQLGLSEIESKLALERLKRLQFLEEVDGKLVRTADNLTTEKIKGSTPSLRKRIQQVHAKSIESLERDPIEIRNHSTMTMAIDPEQIPLAKKAIQQFMEDLSQVLQTRKKKVYELQVNLFPLQKDQK